MPRWHTGSCGPIVLNARRMTSADQTSFARPNSVPGTAVPVRPPSPLVIALVGLVSLSLAMGLGRFSFTPLLPMMLHDGRVDLAQGSWLATSNYLGLSLIHI